MLNAVIASGASLSGVIDLTPYNSSGGKRAVGLQMPAAWTAANLTFFVSLDGVTFQELYDGQGNEYTVIANAANYILLDPSVFGSFLWFKIQSGTTASPVNQAASRTIGINIG